MFLLRSIRSRFGNQNNNCSSFKQQATKPYSTITKEFTNPDQELKVIIVGAGLGGLVMAHRLKQLKGTKKIKIIVLERDEANGKRHQGLVIGLRQEAVDILTKLEQHDILRNLFDAEGPQDVNMVDAQGNVWMRLRELLQVQIGNEYYSGLLDRSQLRNALAKPLDDGTILWNSRFVRFEERDDGVTVELENGQKIEGDILVAFDGARSSIRAQLAPKLIPSHLGIWNVGGASPIDVNDPILQKSLMFQQSRTGLTRVSARAGVSLMSFLYRTVDTKEQVLLWSLSMPKSVAEEFNISNQDFYGKKNVEIGETPAVGICKKYFGSAVGAKELVEAVDGGKADLGYEMTSVLPAVLKADGLLFESKRVTLGGDAAHKTTTQAGVGTTFAFQDGIDLAETILSIPNPNKEGIAKALAEYHDRMKKRALSAVNQSYGNTTMIHKQKGPVLDFFMGGLMRIIGLIAWVLQGFYIPMRNFYQKRS